MEKEIERAEAFAAELTEAYGSALRSVVLYGSAARGEFREGLSKLDLLVLLTDTEPATVRKGSILAREWVAEGNPPPLLLSEQELRRSLDVFPIEYSDIRDAHRVLHGDDPFAEIVIDREHLRLQCEHELKGKQIQLRERYLLSAEQPDELGNLLIRSISTFLVLFRAALRLAGESVPARAEAVVEQVGARAGFPPEPLREILRARQDGSVFQPAPTDPVVVGYLDAVARTVEWVDRLGTAGSQS